MTILRRSLVIVTTSIAAGGLAWFVATRPAPPAPVAPSPSAASAAPIGALDRPASEAVFSRTLDVAGWALAAQGRPSVEVRFAGASSRAATTGLPRPDVADVLRDRADAGRSGFAFSETFATLRAQRWPFEVVAVDAAGRSTTLGRRSLIPPEAMTLWEEAAPRGDVRAFHFLMATSGIGQGGANEIDTAYAGYASATVRVGMSVPVLYLRTTHGRARDWTFDADFDVTRRCGERRLADDSLSAVLRYAIERRIPLQLILNGGIWADAACDAPEWDLNDHLESDPANCQWTQDDKVHPDSYLRNLPGSTQSPELARSLTLNVYATSVRRYKKRNLQAAASRVATFAREHPDLFVGVNLDSDTYTNPFHEQREWFDYNPGTLRQFREWLRASGPYAGLRSRDVPDLRAFRRARPLTLADVNALAGRQWKRWDDVQPPRRFPGSEHQPLQPGERLVWDDPWFREWDTFRKHLVQLHYDELAQWTHEAGIARERIFSAQGFVAPEGPARPFAVRVTSAGQNYDSGGVSIEGAIPRSGHLGAILYGPAAVNRARMEHRHGLFATFARMDPAWAVVETNTADLKRPEKLPTYADAYRAFRDLFNYDARQVSLMAWNGSNGIYAGQPGYVSYTSWRNTPAEEAMRDFLVSHAGLAPGSRLWTFGSAQHADDDGWTAERGTVSAEPARLVVRAAGDSVTLVSPGDQVIRRTHSRALVIGIDAGAASRIEVVAEREPGSGFATVASVDRADPGRVTRAGMEIALDWPSHWPQDAIVERLHVRLHGVPTNAPITVDRIALVGEADVPARTAPAQSPGRAARPSPPR